jgi:hypothetical protein
MDDYVLRNPPKRILETLDGHTTLKLDYRGTQCIADRPERLLCDFCCHPVDRLWCYPTRAVAIEVRPGKPRGAFQCDEAPWNACVYCNPMFRDGDARALAARVRTLAPGQYAHIPLEKVYAVLFEARYSDPFEWNAGELRPGKR